MIDFHCHLDLFSDPVRVAARCVDEGIYVLSVTTTPRAWRVTRTFECKKVKTALGLHPQLAHQRMSELKLFDQFLSETRYVGEIGLDGSPDFKRYWKDQMAVFSHILSSCEHAGGRIMSIHSRHAGRQVIDVLTKYPNAGIPVLHWYSGTLKDLDRAVKGGCWFSVGLPMVRSKKGRKLIKEMPRNHILTETDAPFAMVGDDPVKPWDMLDTVVELADIWGIDKKDADQTLRDNFKNITSILR